MKAYNIALSEDAFQISLLHTIDFSRSVTVPQHFHVEGAAVFRHFFPDMSQADNTDSFFGKLCPGIIQSAFVSVCLHISVQLHDVFIPAQDQRHHMFGDRIGIYSRRIADLYAVTRAGFQIDVIVSCSCLHQSQSGGFFQKRRVDFHVFGNQNFCVADFILDLSRRADAYVPLVRKTLSDVFFCSFRKAADDHDLHLTASFYISSFILSTMPVGFTDISTQAGINPLFTAFLTDRTFDQAEQ